MYSPRKVWYPVFVVACYEFIVAVGVLAADIFLRGARVCMRDGWIRIVVVLGRRCVDEQHTLQSKQGKRKFHMFVCV